LPELSRTRPWWSHPFYLTLLAIGMAVPLIAPPIAPLADLPGHMGRYAIQLGISPFLNHYYRTDWAWIGNLGVDLLLLPLGHLIGVEAGTKLVVLLIPPLTAAGFLWVAREAHGRVPPTAAFALPLILGYPFQFGFLNHALSIALAFLAFGLWLRMGPGRRRILCFVPIALVIWTAHAFGWAVLCLCCFAAEWVRARDAGRSIVWAVPVAAMECLCLAAPILPMLLWRSGASAGATTGFFDWQAKFGAMQSVLRDRWTKFDGDAAMLLVGLLGLGVLGVLRFERRLFAAAALLAVAFALLPRTLIGSDYADMRLAPTLLATGLLALTPRANAPRWAGAAIAVAALAFYGVRIAAATASMLLHSATYDRQLEAIPHIPLGARIYTLVATPCPRGWDVSRLDHLGSLAIVRRQAFVNDQWVAAGAQLVTVRLPIAAAFASNGAQQTRLPGCDRPEPLLADRLRSFPRAAFDHVWLIDVPAAFRPRDAGLVPIWQNEVGALYRIRR
jgi:hypothetical protein